MSSVAIAGIDASVDLIEMEAQQEPMVLGHAAAKRLAELLMGRLDARGWARLASLAGLVSPAIIAVDHGAAAFAHQIGEH